MAGKGVLAGGCLGLFWAPVGRKRANITFRVIARFDWVHIARLKNVQISGPDVGRGLRRTGCGRSGEGDTIAVVLSPVWLRDVLSMIRAQAYIK